MGGWAAYARHVQLWEDPNKKRLRQQRLPVPRSLPTGHDLHAARSKKISDLKNHSSENDDELAKKKNTLRIVLGYFHSWGNFELLLLNHLIRCGGGKGKGEEERGVET